MRLSDCAATVPVDCDSCSGPVAGEAYETIVDGRLHWVLTHDCPGGEVEAMGWDETPAELRQAILDQCGLYRLRLDREPGGGKVAVLKVLRGSGRTLSEASGALADLLGPGIPGTEAELHLLATRLQRAGGTPSVRRDGR